MMVMVLSIIAILSKFRKGGMPFGMVKVYILYFLVGLSGWIFNGLANQSTQYIVIDDGGGFYILCSYLLLIGVSRNRCNPLIHRLAQGISIITFSLVILETSVVNQVLMLSIFGFVFYVPVFIHSLTNTLRDGNFGDGMISTAIAAHVILSAIQVCLVVISENPSLAHSLGIINASSGYLLVGIGFIASILFREHHLLTLHAIEDPLTGLLNRRGLEYSLNLITLETGNKKSCISAILLDIDHFKKVNDLYGHDAGDEVLKVFARKIDENHRGEDVCCRLGGEEFAIIVPWATSDGARKMAENLRQTIEKSVIEINGESISVTSSFGVATQCAEIEIEALLKKADKALYRAKASGRNQVCVSE
jgi:diguanylate cyclase (GGDEF)-like protein